MAMNVHHFPLGTVDGDFVGERRRTRRKNWQLQLRHFSVSLFRSAPNKLNLGPSDLPCNLKNYERGQEF